MLPEFGMMMPADVHCHGLGGVIKRCNKIGEIIGGCIGSRHHLQAQAHFHTQARRHFPLIADKRFVL